ncbi:MAG TPA: ABC transporter permease [Acidimicrobiales bacterium]|nr:ABC transporter permease [Acidimicrobiales bacterium]
MTPTVDAPPAAGPSWRSAPPLLRVAATLAVVGALWWVLDQTLPRGLPMGIVVAGAVFGSIYALNAIGLVLVFRANRVVNFAQAEFGVVAAVLSIQFVLQWNWSFYAAVVAGLVIAALVAGLVEATIIRRFSRAPRLILAVVTIALAQVLVGVAQIVPLYWKGTTTNRFEVPFEARFEVFPVIFDASHVLALAVVPVVLLALVAFLRFSPYGMAIRAAAENGDRARLMGIPVPRLSTIVWTIAGVLSALAVLLRVCITGFSSFSSVSGGGSSLLLFTLAAAVIGRMERLPTTVAAAVALGVFQEAVIWNWSNTTLVDATLILLILGALLLQRDAFSRVAQAGASTWTALREVRPVPAELRGLPEVRWAGLGLRVVLVAAAVAVPWVASPSQLGAASLVLVYAMVAISLYVLTGLAGHISLGQWALVGFGGATTTLLHGRYDVEIVLAMLGGAVVAALVALVLGLPALRIRGLFLAVTTLAFAVTSATYFLQERYVPWFIERRIDRPDVLGRLSLESDTTMYLFSLLVLLGVMTAVRGLRWSRTGRVLIAVRDNELAAEAVTLDATRLKLVAFVIAGAIAGLAGGVYVVQQEGIFSDAFGPEVSLLLFSMVVIGGLGTMPGAVLGAIYIRGAQFFLPSGWELVASGLGILVLLLIFPEGLGGMAYSVRDHYLRWVARRRGVAVPSLIGAPPPDDGVPAAPSLRGTEGMVPA